MSALARYRRNLRLTLAALVCSQIVLALAMGTIGTLWTLRLREDARALDARSEQIEARTAQWPWRPGQTGSEMFFAPQVVPCGTPVPGAPGCFSVPAIGVTTGPGLVLLPGDGTAR